MDILSFFFLVFFIVVVVEVVAVDELHMDWNKEDKLNKSRLIF